MLRRLSLRLFALTLVGLVVSSGMFVFRMAIPGRALRIAFGPLVRDLTTIGFLCDAGTHRGAITNAPLQTRCY